MSPELRKKPVPPKGACIPGGEEGGEDTGEQEEGEVILEINMPLGVPCLCPPWGGMVSKAPTGGSLLLIAKIGKKA